MAGPRLNLPNLITIARIAVCPVIFFLALSEGVPARMAAFVLFVAAALSDLWDGHLARKHGWITDTGKLLDPIADKLLVVCTFVPFYILSHSADPVNAVPWWGELPMWVLLVVFGREALITAFRSWAVRRGVVISAGTSGKYKAFSQVLFVGGLLFWYPLLMIAQSSGWVGMMAWTGWSLFHSFFISATLTVALFLTVYSMVDYLWSYRALARVQR